MKELLAKEFPWLTFVEVYFGYGMHDETSVAYFLGQVVANNLLNCGVEVKVRRQSGLIPTYCCYYYCNLFFL
jgi:hypothetical protein